MCSRVKNINKSLLKPLGKDILCHWCIGRWRVEEEKPWSENLYKSLKTDKKPTNRQGMEISAVLIGLVLSLGLWEINGAQTLNGSGKDPKQRAELTEDRTEFSSQASSVKCKLQGTTRLPAFSVDGDYVIGGVFSIHRYKYTVKHNYTTMPEPVRCTGRLVRGRSEMRILHCVRMKKVLILMWTAIVWLLWRKQQEKEI